MKNKHPLDAIRRKVRREWRGFDEPLDLNAGVHRAAEFVDEIVRLVGLSERINKVAFSPDGQRVAGVSADTTVALWDTSTGRVTAPLRGHTDQVWAVAFAPDGRTIATGAWDKTARIWGVSAADVFRARAGQPEGVSPSCR